MGGGTRIMCFLAGVDVLLLSGQKQVSGWGGVVTLCGKWEL